jgi:hypothetical protein
VVATVSTGSILIPQLHNSQSISKKYDDRVRILVSTEVEVVDFVNEKATCGRLLTKGENAQMTVAENVDVSYCRHRVYYKKYLIGSTSVLIVDQLTDTVLAVSE